MPAAGARPSRYSQSGKILALLERGGWWSTRDLLRHVPSIVHSRVSELRRTWGYEIEHRHVGPGAAGSQYRLVGAALAGDRVTTAPVPRERGPLGRADEPRLGSAARDSGEPAPPPDTVLAVSSSVLPSRPPAVLAWRAGAPVGSPAVPSPGPRNDERAAGGQLDLFRGAA